MERADRRRPEGVLVTAAGLGAAVMLLGAMTQAVSPTIDEPALRRALESLNARATGLQTIRHLRAGALTGKHSGWLNAEVALGNDGTFSDRVLEEGGSSRTREKVLRGGLTLPIAVESLADVRFVGPSSFSMEL